MKKIKINILILCLLLIFILSGCSSKEIVFKFDTQGAGQIEDITVNTNKDNSFKLPENPTKDGYMFTGWYLDKEANERFINTKIEGSLITLYAGWKELSANEKIYGLWESQNAVMVVDAMKGVEILINKNDSYYQIIGSMSSIDEENNYKLYIDTYVDGEIPFYKPTSATAKLDDNGITLEIKLKSASNPTIINFKKAKSYNVINTSKEVYLYKEKDIGIDETIKFEIPKLNLNAFLIKPEFRSNSYTTYRIETANSINGEINIKVENLYVKELNELNASIEVKFDIDSVLSYNKMVGSKARLYETIIPALKEGIKLNIINGVFYFDIPADFANYLDIELSKKGKTRLESFPTKIKIDYNDFDDTFEDLPEGITSDDLLNYNTSSLINNLLYESINEKNLFFDKMLARIKVASQSDESVNSLLDCINKTSFKVDKTRSKTITYYTQDMLNEFFDSLKSFLDNYCYYFDYLDEDYRNRINISNMYAFFESVKNGITINELSMKEVKKKSTIETSINFDVIANIHNKYALDFSQILSNFQTDIDLQAVGKITDTQKFSKFKIEFDIDDSLYTNIKDIIYNE